MREIIILGIAIISTAAVAAAVTAAAVSRKQYDRFGYDADGYSRNGYDRHGYDRSGYDINGYTYVDYSEGYEEALASYNRSIPQMENGDYLFMAKEIQDGIQICLKCMLAHYDSNWNRIRDEDFLTSRLRHLCLEKGLLSQELNRELCEAIYWCTKTVHEENEVSEAKKAQRVLAKLMKLIEKL